jgi:uncharacterized protein (DUF488 family)
LTKKLFTIGYTGLSIDEFVNQLVFFGIKHLVDIREIPLSRKKGFSKTVLTQTLESHGINYTHFRLLGSPRVLRHELRDTRNYKVFFSGVKRHLKQLDVLQQMDQAIQIAKKQRSCLMCCCENWTVCHRSSVVDAILSRSSFTVTHLRFEFEKSINRAAA